MKLLDISILQIFKFMGVFVSFVSGVLATAFETKEDSTSGGGKKLNRTGRVLLSFVVLGSFVSGITQYLEDRGKRKAQFLADEQRSEDVRRMSYIIDGTERLAHRLEPLTWRAIVRHRVDSKSVLWTYLERIRRSHPGTVGFDLVNEFRPKRDDPGEARAWEYLMKPRVYVAVLGKDIFEHEGKTLPVPIMHDVPLLLEAVQHSDRDGTWKPGPNATLPPFYSRMTLKSEKDFFWLTQEFVIRNSPDALRSLGIISPLDLSGLLVVAETPQAPYSVVDKLIIKFPSARNDIELDMKPTDPVMDWNRTLAVLDAAVIRHALGLPLKTK